MSAHYRAYRVQVIVAVHQSHPEDRDAGIIESITKEITDLATGDVIIISAHPIDD